MNDKHEVVHWTLVKRGFQRDASETLVDAYRGTLNVLGKKIVVVLEITDWLFVTPPLVRLDEKTTDLKEIRPHVFWNGGLCYLGGARLPVMDQYDPGGLILRCLDEAQRTLEEIITGRSAEEIAAEFFAYWNSPDGITTAYVDVEKGFEDLIPYREIWTSSRPPFAICTDRNEYLKTFNQIALDDSSRSSAFDRRAAIVSIERDSNISTSVWPPKTLQEVFGWLDELYPGASAKITHYLGLSGKARIIGEKNQERAVDPVLLLAFKNGIFGLIVQVPPSFKKSKDITRTTAAYTNILKTQASKIKVHRFTGQEMKPSSIVERNMDSDQSLSGISIALIGCGTIGSHLARFLVQAGAGIGDQGKLLLIDNDRLKPGNLGRHILGMPFLHQNKADACTEYLMSDFPGTSVEACCESVLKILPRLSSFNVVIDATGEEALSVALNHLIIRLEKKRPAALFVWLEGNGVSARGLLNSDRGDACYKCLRPSLKRPERFPALKKTSDTRTVEANQCGDGNYTPYSVAASVTAATLGLQMLLDHVNGHSTPRFRTKIILDKDARITKDQDVKPASDCDACSKLNSPG